MPRVVDQDDFDDLKDDVRDIEKDLSALDEDFEKRVNERVAEIFREMAATAILWPTMTFEDHLNNAAKKLEEGE